MLIIKSIDSTTINKIYWCFFLEIKLKKFDTNIAWVIRLSMCSASHLSYIIVLKISYQSLRCTRFHRTVYLEKPTVNFLQFATTVCFQSSFFYIDLKIDISILEVTLLFQWKNNLILHWTYMQLERCQFLGSSDKL